MGDEQRLLRGRADQRWRASSSRRRPDFTIAVEEEFAILDPETLDLTNRFEDVQAAARGHRARGAPRRRADRLRGRGPHGHAARRSPTCRGAIGRAARAAAATLADAARRRASARPARTRGADWQEQRIIDTPHYRRNDELLRYVVWRNNTFGLHVHVAINGADRAIAVVATRCATSSPSCSRSRRARRSSEDVNTRPALGAHADLHALLPALRRPGRVRRAGRRTRRYVRFLYDDGLDHRAHAALVERAPAPRVPDGRDPDLRRAARARRGAARWPLSRTRSTARWRARYDEGDSRSSRCRTG